MTIEQYNESIRLYANRIFRFVFKQMKSREDAQDIVQNTFEKVWKKREEVEVATVRQYLFTIAYRDMLNVIKKQQRTQSMEVMPEGLLTEHKSYTGIQEILDEALDRLPKIQKTIVLLRDYEGYQYQEIGEITNLNDSQVKVYLHRARKSLKNYLISIEKLL